MDFLFRCEIHHSNPPSVAVDQTNFKLPPTTPGCSGAAGFTIYALIWVLGTMSFFYPIWRYRRNGIRRTPWPWEASIHDGICEVIQTRAVGKCDGSRMFDRRRHYQLTINSLQILGWSLFIHLRPTMWAICYGTTFIPSFPSFDNLVYSMRLAWPRLFYFDKSCPNHCTHHVIYAETNGSNARLISTSFFRCWGPILVNFPHPSYFSSTQQCLLLLKTATLLNPHHWYVPLEA